MKRIVVLAGNYDQYRDWCGEHEVDPRKTVYVSDRFSLMGLCISEDSVIRCGSWYARPDIDEIEQTLRERAV